MVTLPPTIDWAMLTPSEQASALERAPLSSSQSLKDGVARILARVRENGDEALFDLTQQLDGVRLDNLETPLPEALSIDSGLSRALEDAASRIQVFHEACSPQDIAIDTARGVHCRTLYRPIQRVGLYVPGGHAALISTVLMLGIPARLAGCEERILCTPPRRDGSVAPGILAAAKLAGISRVFTLGGAQAIAAMAFGTDSIPRCDKLFGPGNAWVTEAKQQVACTPGGAAIDMPAGPSEVMVIADETANPDFVALDLLAQSEHGPDSQSLLLSTCPDLIEQVRLAINNRLSEFDELSVLEQSLRHLRLILTRDLDQALAIANNYAPEHLLVQCANPERCLPRITNAGSVFLGPWTPESLGDYCSGPNHVLPTYGYARAYGGLGVSDFMKRMTVQSATRAGLELIGPTAATLADAESLKAHALAVRARLDSPGAL